MVKVMDVDLERRRISLSMRSAAETLGITIEIVGGSDEEEAAEEAAAETLEEIAVDEAEAAADAGRRRG